MSNTVFHKMWRCDAVLFISHPPRQQVAFGTFPTCPCFSTAIITFSVQAHAQPADCRHVGSEPAEGRFLPAPLCVCWQGRGSQQVFTLVLTCKCYMCSSLGFFSFTSSLTKTNLKRSYFSPSIQRNTHILLLITVLTVILETATEEHLLGRHTSQKHLASFVLFLIFRQISLRQRVYFFIKIENIYLIGRIINYKQYSTSNKGFISNTLAIFLFCFL